MLSAEGLDPLHQKGEGAEADAQVLMVARRQGTVVQAGTHSHRLHNDGTDNPLTIRTHRTSLESTSKPVKNRAKKRLSLTSRTCDFARLADAQTSAAFLQVLGRVNVATVYIIIRPK